MTATPDYELPAAKERAHRKAVRLERITIAYLLSAIFFIYLTLGSSQAMKTAWFEDILSLVPPIAFLVASRVRRRKPDAEHPYGWHRAVSIGYLIASLALFSMGFFLLFDAVMSLISFEHPSIGTVTVLGHHVWLGWLMIPAAAYSGFPAMFIGRLKLPLANELHDKVLFADAKMNKADWLTAMAAILGVLGIGVGWWWADGAAAAVISLDILHDGVSNLRRSLSDLMDSSPTRVDGSARDPLPSRLETELEKLQWVRAARARMREEGHVYYGEVFVVPTSEGDLTAKIAQATRQMLALDWRVHDLVITPVSELPSEDAERRL